MRVASLSFWHLHAADYADAISEHPHLELAAIWDDDVKRGRAAAEKYGVDFVAELGAVLDDPTIEGVIVCSPTSTHVAIVRRAVAAGKHVFMEKVLSSSLSGAEDIVQAARASEIALTVSLWRSDRGYARQIARLVAEGWVGTVTSARIRDGHPFALPSPERPGGVLPAQFHDPAEAQGGILIDLCHPVYLLAMILGLPMSVTGTVGRTTGQAVEDNATVVMAYESGAIAIAETSSVTRITPFTIEVHGTEGSIIYTEPGIGELVANRHRKDSPAKAPAPRVRVSSTRYPDANWHDLEVEDDAPMAIDQWYAHATTGTRGEANIHLALELSSLIEAAYFSANSGASVAVRAV